jgi:hypothetical protein
MIVFSIFGGPIENLVEVDNNQSYSIEFSVVGSMILVEPRELIWSFP